jgi:hypothetical protein
MPITPISNLTAGERQFEIVVRAGRQGNREAIAIDLVVARPVG